MMRRSVAGFLTMAGLVLVLISIWQDALVAVTAIMAAGVCVYGLAVFDIDARAPDDRSGW